MLRQVQQTVNRNKRKYRQKRKLLQLCGLAYSHSYIPKSGAGLSGIPHTARHLWRSSGIVPRTSCLAPKMRLLRGLRVSNALKRRVPSKDERKWARLQLSIPIFVRSRNANGKDSLEFATALNISAGGALVIVRRSVPKSALISLEIPIVPIEPANGLPTSSRVIRAKTVWVAHLDDRHLLGLKFARPLPTNAEALPRELRKAVSAV